MRDTIPSRRAFLWTSLGGIACGAGLGQAWSKAPASRQPPNIVFIMVDDMGWADLGCYGQTAYATPRLDRMAAEGIRFTEAYSGCTVCAPARSTLMTGLHMGHTPVRGNTGGIPLPADTVTVAEVLKKAGYAVGGFGKWGLGDLDTEGVPERQGFDTFFGYYHQVHAHNYYPDYLIDTGRKVPLSGKPDTAERHAHYRIVARMKQWIREQRGRPFFCYAPWTPPHASYQIPADDPAWQAVKGKTWPGNVKGHAAFNLMIDRHVGEILDLLEELKLSRNTIVFFCSDNGASMRNDGTLDSSGPLTGCKRSMHEGGLRVPFIVRWPGHIRAGQVSDLPTYFPDVMPTLAELAGAAQAVPVNIDGISLVPSLLEGAGTQRRHEYLYWEWPKYDWRNGQYHGMMQAVRHGRWKLLRHAEKAPWQLYDLQTDLAEKHDLAAAQPDRVARLAAWVAANRVEPPPQLEPERSRGKRFR